MQTARKYYALIAFVIACVAIAGILPGVYAAPLHTPVNPGNSGLISWWSLDETSGTRNDSYSTNHLSDNNTVGYTTGKKGNAADFISANTEYLSVADNAALSPNYVTVGGWVNLKSKATQNIFLKYSAGDPSFAVYYDTTSDRFICLLVRSDSTSTSVTASTFGSPSTSTWYLVFCEYDGSTVSISVNAGAANTSALAGVLRNSSVPFVLGSSVNFYLNSYLDEVFMYNRALSADEREWLYNSGTGRTYSELAPTATPTNTSTVTHTPTITFTPSKTPTITFTPSNTPTITSTPSNTPTITYTPSNTPTITYTPSNTATATPSTCSDGGTLTSGLWTNTSGVNADTCTNNNIRMEWQEPDSGSGSSVSAAFTTTSTTFYDVTFNGHYTGTHTIKLQCQDDVTPSLYHDLAVLDISLGVDETINAEMPQTCNDGTPILRFYNTNAGNSLYYLKIDQLILTAQPATATPTITNTPTRTPTVTATATKTATSAATNTATETATPTITNTATETFTPTITFTPTVTRTPMPTRTPGGPDMPLLNWNGDVSYGEFATTITVSLLCLLVIIGGAVTLTLNTLNKKKGGL